MGAAARGAAIASEDDLVDDLVDDCLMKGGAGVLVSCEDLVACLASCAPLKRERLGDHRRGGGRLMGRGRLAGVGCACLAVWSSAFTPADQPSRPPPTGSSLESGGVCTAPARPMPLTPIRLIRKAIMPQEDPPVYDGA